MKYCMNHTNIWCQNDGIIEEVYGIVQKEDGRNREDKQ